MDEDSSPQIKKEKTAAEIRKSNKPLMEKRRRERINNCLEQLKSILMEVTKKESSYYSKLEKADILEMTVKYLKNMKRQQLAVAMATDPSVVGKYIAGFNECTSEVTKYLNSIDGMTPELRTRLLGHLANCLQRSSVSVATSTATNSLQMAVNQATQQSLGVQIPTATQLSALPGSGGLCLLSPNNPPIQTISASPMQLVPAKLPSGELVLLLANPQSLSSASQGLSIVSPQQLGSISTSSSAPSTAGPIRLQPSPTSTLGTASTFNLDPLAHAPVFSFPAGLSNLASVLTEKTLKFSPEPINNNNNNNNSNNNNINTTSVGQNIHSFDNNNGSPISSRGSSPPVDNRLSDADSPCLREEAARPPASLAALPPRFEVVQNLEQDEDEIDEDDESESDEEEDRQNNNAAAATEPVWRPW